MKGCAARSRYSWTTASFALVSLCALCSRLRPPFAEAVVRLPLTRTADPQSPRRRRPSALARARRGVSRVGGDAPLGEKAFSSDPKRVPWGTASPSRRPSSARVSLASQGGPSAPCGEGPPSGALPAYRGPRLPPPSRGRVTHGPGPGIPGAVLRPRCCGRVRRLTPRGEVWGGAARPPTPPASPRRAALRPLPSRAAAGGRRAGTGWARLARGCRSPGCGFPEPRPDGWRKRKTDAVGGGFPLGGAEFARGAPGGGGRAAARLAGGWPRPVGVPGVAGPPSCVAVGSPCVFPAARLAPSALPRGARPRARALSSRGLPSCARPPRRRCRFAPSRPGAYRGRPLVARVSSPPPTSGRAAAPHGGASLGAR